MSQKNLFTLFKTVYIAFLENTTDACSHLDVKAIPKGRGGGRFYGVR